MVEPTSRRSQRLGREDELLELGPAIRLGGDALAVRMGERVDRDPVAGLAGRTAEELPRPLGLAVQRPLEQIEGEPPRLEMVLVEQPVGDEQEARRAVALGGVPEAAGHGRHQRPAHAVDGADAGRDPLLAFEVLGVGETLEAGRQGVRECVGVLDELCEVGAEGFGAGSVVGDEGDGSRGDLASCVARSSVGTPAASVVRIGSGLGLRDLCRRRP